MEKKREGREGESGLLYILSHCNYAILHRSIRGRASVEHILFNKHEWKEA